MTKPPADGSRDGDLRPDIEISDRQSTLRRVPLDWGAQGGSQHLESGLAARCPSGMEPGSRPPAHPGTSGGETVVPAPVRSEVMSTGGLGSPMQMRGGRWGKPLHRGLRRADPAPRQPKSLPSSLAGCHSPRSVPPAPKFMFHKDKSRSHRRNRSKGSGRLRFTLSSSGGSRWCWGDDEPGILDASPQGLPIPDPRLRATALRTLTPPSSSRCPGVLH